MPGTRLCFFLAVLIFPSSSHPSTADKAFYHTSNSHECMGVNGEALQLHAVYKKPYFVL